MTSYRMYQNYANPILTCTNQNDRFTVKDTTLGNGALTYPVGLITLDEVVMAEIGATVYENYDYYLYTGYNYWTMTPSRFREAGPSDFDGVTVFLNAVTYYGGLGTAAFTYDNLGVRPVLSLKSDVQLQGNGTMDSPFEVVS